jgi:hypothetical protein
MADDPAVYDAMLAIAGTVAPDEIDLAPTILDAYLAGGRDRQELFRDAGGPTVAAFGAGEVATFLPGILAALAGVAAAIGPPLARLLGPTADALSCANGLVELRKQRDVPPAEVRAIAEAQAPSAAPALVEVIEVLDAQLAAEGLDAGRRSEVTLGCVKALLESGSAGPLLVAELGRAGR